MGTQTKTLQYRYDSRGNRSALIDHDGGRFTYSYDTVNRITQVLNPQGNRTTYSYDSAGRRTLKKLSNATRASFTYDAAGNLTKLYNLKNTGAVISSFDYKYDKVGNRTAVLEAGGSRVTWSYDNAYQLTGEHRTGSNAYRDTYTYDPAGNRLLKNHDGARTTYAYDAANQLTYSQDAGGRTTFTFDADGNQQVVREPSGNRTTYVWDYENRMTLARLPSGIRNTMAYDADGLRVKLEESTGAKKFVWDDQNYLGETDGANDTQVVYTNEPQRYGNLVSQRRASTSHWYHFDAIGSTRELTDSSAVVSDTRLYDAWGNAIASTGTTVSPLRWVGDVGYYFDAQLGLYYVRARLYSPVDGRWRSVDPRRVLTQSPYTYSDASPVRLYDPTGMAAATPTRDCCQFQTFTSSVRYPPNRSGWVKSGTKYPQYIGCEAHFEFSFSCCNCRCCSIALSIKGSAESALPPKAQDPLQWRQKCPDDLRVKTDIFRPYDGFLYYATCPETPCSYSLAMLPCPITLGVIMIAHRRNISWRQNLVIRVEAYNACDLYRADSREFPVTCSGRLRSLGSPDILEPPQCSLPAGVTPPPLF